jgi:hypothetical protein
MKHQHACSHLAVILIGVVLLLSGTITTLAAEDAAPLFALQDDGKDAKKAGAPTANSPFIFSLTANYHAEFRDDLYADGYDILAACDFLLSDSWGLYAGPRIGWYGETVCTAFMSGSLSMYQKPSIGGQIYFNYPSWISPNVQGIAGVAFDMLINWDKLHNQGTGDTLYLFISCFLGVRWLVSDTTHLEFRIEGGEFPFFEGTPYFLKFGLQVGWRK